jgi:hypothetical protein
MEYWIFYDLASGEERMRGSGPIGTAAVQRVPEGLGIALVPAAAAMGQTLDLDLIRAALEIQIDNEAEQVRGRFITALPGQVGTYWLKAEVARKWLADNTSSTVMLASEARSRRMTIADLAAEVIANADAWAFAADAIEGLRWDAKFEMAQATTFGAIVEASKVDWSALTNG